MSTPSTPKMSEFHTGLSQSASSWGSVEELFNKQKAHFATDATKTYEWRVDQLDRLVRMLREHYQRFADASCKDFKTELVLGPEISGVEIHRPGNEVAGILTRRREGLGEPRGSQSAIPQPTENK